MATATQHVEKMSANLGGTNLLSPIQAILSEKPKEGIPRQLFILTDGMSRHFTNRKIITINEKTIKTIKNQIETNRIENR